MGRMDGVRTITAKGGEGRAVGAVALGGTLDPRVAAGDAALALPDALTWSATLDPHDETREIEITDEMVCRALDRIEEEQVYPFRREAGAPPPVARPLRKADVIAFPKVG